MQNTEWITLLRQLPEELHANIVFVLNNRTDITVETIFRLEPAFAVIRGRQGGTTDGGILFIIPYDQLSAIYLYHQIKESEIHSIFGKPGATPPPAPMPRSATGSGERPAPIRPSAQGLSFGRPPEATAIARNNLLERLRAARQAAMPPPTNGKS